MDERADRAVTLSQVVHLTLRGRFEPDANFDKQRPADLPAHRSPNRCVCSAMIRTAPCFCQAHRDRADERREARCVTEWNGNEAMKYKYRINERDYQDRLATLLNNALNTNLQPLRSL